MRARPSLASTGSPPTRTAPHAHAASGLASSSDDDAGSFDDEGDSDGAPAKKKLKGAGGKPAAGKPAAGAPKAKAGGGKAGGGKAGGGKAGGKTPKAPKAPKAAKAAGGDAGARAGGKGAAAASTGGKGASSSSAAAAAAAAPSGGGGGAPPKKPLNDAEAEALLASYMARANRPYSPINVFDNLHGALSKPTLVRLLDKLAGDGRLVMKAFGKAQVYWADQGQYGDVSPEALAALGETEKEAAAEAGAASAARKALAQQAAALGNAMTDGELEAALAAARAAAAASGAKLAALRAAAGSGALVSASDRAKAKATLDRFRGAWRDRKDKVMVVRAGGGVGGWGRRSVRVRHGWRGGLAAGAVGRSAWQAAHGGAVRLPSARQWQPPSLRRSLSALACLHSRARTGTQIVNNMSEGLNKKPKEIIAAIGIETDEAEGVKLGDFVA